MTLLRAGRIKTCRPRRFLLSVCLLLFSFPGLVSSKMVHVSQRYITIGTWLAMHVNTESMAFFSTHMNTSSAHIHLNTDNPGFFLFCVSSGLKLTSETCTYLHSLDPQPPLQILAWALSLTSMSGLWDPYPVISLALRPGQMQVTSYSLVSLA